MRFVRSALGRMLIADEVVSGKTIEAIYIWRELQARTDARRLLVVCPAGLRRKWQEELASRFSIHADYCLPARMDVDVLDRDFLLALAAMPVEGFDQR